MPDFKKIIKNKKFLVVAAIILLLAVFAAGWLSAKIKTGKEELCKSAPLRLNNFKFVKPLLVCDTNAQKDYAELKPLNQKLNDVVSQEEADGHITAASIYFQDFQTDGRININQNEKFHPASMEKVSIMLAYYRLAESDPNILSSKIKFTADAADNNFGQEIKPRDFARAGETYTVEELIKKMIKYSDNNSRAVLLSLIKPATIKSLYEDLDVPLQINSENPENFDYITTKDMSYFFRILYNSTYLTNDLSDKALGILSESDYKNGLTAGVPDGTIIAHKFGLATLDVNGKTTGRELHDCGVVYHPRNPYLLCVMTKSTAEIADIETAIKNISGAIWNYENSR